LRISDWIILLTNVPKERLSAEASFGDYALSVANRALVEAGDKQHGKIDAWRSEKPARIETEIEASIIGLLIQHWTTVLGCWENPERSLRKAQQVTQWGACVLGFALMGEMSLSRVIGILTNAMGKSCRIDSRRKKPNTYQLVRDPALIHS
jgi:hypothetical protein